MHIHETETYRDCTIKIVLDESPENPRTAWDNLGTLALKQGGDRLNVPTVNSLEELVQVYERAMGGPIVYLKVRRYSHGSDGFKTYEPDEEPTGYPWNCPWDSGWAGIIFVTRAKIREEYSCKRITPGVMAKVKACLEAEVETYSAYVNGEVYGYVVEDPEGNDLDSCWGYYGNDLDYCKQCAKDAVDHWHKHTQTPSLFESAV